MVRVRGCEDLSEEEESFRIITGHREVEAGRALFISQRRRVSSRVKS